jgi:hypothetical protein
MLVRQVRLTLCIPRPNNEKDKISLPVVQRDARSTALKKRLAPNFGPLGDEAQGNRRPFRGKARMVWTVRRERKNKGWAGRGRENEWGTYAAFAHAHRLAAPLVANCALELE